MGNLIRNERLKLYKRPSTWILTGIIVALSLIGLILSNLLMGSAYVYDWRWSCEQEIEYYTMVLRENPEDAEAAKYLEINTYRLENDISPSDWRSSALEEYASLKYGSGYGDKSGLITIGPDGQPSDGTDGGTAEPDAETLERANALKAMIDSNDWRSYVEQKIADLESGYTPSANEDEKQVSIEMYGLYLEYDVPPSSGIYYGDNTADWRYTQIQSIYANKLALIRGEDDYGNLLSQNKRARLEEENAVSIQRIATDTPPVESASFLGLLESTVTSMELVTLLLIVFAGGIIASEFGTGTVKLLLITPHRRKKIFWSKAVILLEITLITVAAVFVLAFLLCGAFTGFQGIGTMQVMTLFGQTARFPYLLYIVMKMLLLLLPALAYGALALMLSAVTRKSAVAIAVSLLLMFGSQIVMALIVAYTSYGGGVIPGIKFLFFANTDLAAYLPSSSGAIGAIMGTSGGSLPDNSMTLGFSVAVVLIYTACFLWIARDSFCRRDVK